MCAVLASVLMIMALGVGAMLVSMGVLVLVFMFVSLNRSMGVFMAMNVLMGMRTFHGWYSFQTIVSLYNHLSRVGKRGLSRCELRSAVGAGRRGTSRPATRPAS